MNNEYSEKEFADGTCPVCKSDTICEHVFAVIDQFSREVHGPARDLWKEFCQDESGFHSENEEQSQKQFEYFFQACAECSISSQIVDVDGCFPGMSNQETWEYAIELKQALEKLKSLLSKY